MITLPVWVVTLLILAVVLVVAAVWASAFASRLNRLHVRTDAARISLEGALRARSAVISTLQPELSQQVAHVNRVALRATDMGARSGAENELLSQLDSDIFSQAAFVDASTRVELAARFYNDAVADTLAVRARPVARVLHLAGRAPLPEYYESMQTGELA